MSTSMINATFRASEQINDNRSLYEILAHLTEEAGEIANEVHVAAGRSYKKSTSSVTEECIDVILCALDMIHVANPSITEQDIDAIAIRKINKWLDTRQRHIINLE